MLAIYVTASVGLAYVVKQLVDRQSHRILRDGKLLRYPPDTLPLFGNGLKFLLLDRQSLFEWFSQIHNEIFKFETYQISVPTLPPGIVVSNPDVLEFIMKKEGKEGFGKGPFFEERSWHLFGHGIINASGQLWKTQRKAGNKFFAGSNLQILVDEVFPKFWERAKEELDDAADTGKVIDMEELYLEFTTRVMGRVAFGMDLSNSHPFSAAFDYASDLTGLRFQNPLWKLNYYLFGQKFRKAVSIVKSFGNEIVRLAVCRRESKINDSIKTDFESSKEEEGGDLVDMLLDAVPEHHVVADSAINFLSAGRDTTANSMTWMLHLLLENPEIMQYITDEMPSAGVHTYTTLNTTSTPKSHAVFLETLRLYPPVPFELKQTLNPAGMSLPDGTFLPPGSVIVWCPYAYGRSKEIWGDDAYEFRPDRWIETEALIDGVEEVKLKVRSSSEYPVFNGGARSCLGKRMAEVMGVWVLAESLRNWEFEEVEKIGRRKSRNSLTLPMEGGLKVRVRRKSDICV